MNVKQRDVNKEIQGPNLGRRKKTGFSGDMTRQMYTTVSQEICPHRQTEPCLERVLGDNFMATETKIESDLPERSKS